MTTTTLTIETLLRGEPVQVTAQYSPAVPATTAGRPEDCDLGEDESIDVVSVLDSRGQERLGELSVEDYTRIEEQVLDQVYGRVVFVRS